MTSRKMLRIYAPWSASGRGFVYQHDHYWEQDWQVTPEWKKTFARACIDSGATAFISHGAPLLHGIEIYRQRPIFYDLGNFIFQLWTHLNRDLPPRYRERVVWQSVIAQCRFQDGRLRALRLDPIMLKDVKERLRLPPHWTAIHVWQTAPKPKRFQSDCRTCQTSTAPDWKYWPITPK